MLTETEAKQRWCPMVRMAEEEGSGFAGTWNRTWRSRPIPNPDECRCIASDCAMWRWTDDSAWEGDGLERTAEESDGKWVRRGYCGLAGKP